MSKKRTITADDLYKIEIITDCCISPDGEWVVYCVQSVDRKVEKKRSHLWLVSTRSGTPKQFTFGDQADTSPRWSPDGKQIAFLSNRRDENQSQIHLIPINGGEARPLTNLKGNFSRFEWSPDGRQFVCCFRQKSQEEVELEKNPEKAKLGKVQRHYSRVFYKKDGEGFLPSERWHLWLIDAQSGKAKQVTRGPRYDEAAPIWATDGKTILCCSNRSADPDRDIHETALWKVSPTTGRMRRVDTPGGPVSLPSFSPDGKSIAYFAQKSKGEWWENTQLWTVPASGRGQAKCLTEGHDLTCGSLTLGDLAGAADSPAIWTADSRHLLFQISARGRTSLYSVSSSGQDLREIVGPDAAIGSVTACRDRSHIAFFQTGPTDPGQVWVCEADGNRPQKLTRVNQRKFKNMHLEEPEEVWAKDSAGSRIHGWILKPPSFDPRRKYPSILEIHGGPLAQYGFQFMHEFQFLAAQGFVVHFCNPRGGKGYGEEHARAIWGAWGTADFDDVMSWTDFVARRPYIDRKRMGVTGGSYGGYMTNWILGHTNRFQAAVTQRCVSNLITLWGASDFNWVFQEAFGNRPPWEAFEEYWRQSPVSHLGNARTPTLVIHSEQDHRCPVDQSEQVFVALKTQGVDTELVRFPDESHGLSRGGRTDRRIARLNHILRWFNKYLKGRKVP